MYQLTLLPLAPFGPGGPRGPIGPCNRNTNKAFARTLYKNRTNYHFMPFFHDRKLFYRNIIPVFMPMLWKENIFNFS